MLDSLSQFFISQGFIPHGYCFAWSPPLLWTYVTANALIGLAYFSIPAALVVLTRRRPDMRYNRMAFLFAAFILACGTTHFLDILAVWQPIFWLDAWARVGTAAISVITAIVLWRSIPQLLALPSLAQINETNQQLSEEIAARQAQEDALRASEEQLRSLYATLETKVAERTAELAERTRELAEANGRMQAEVVGRQRMQSELQVVNRQLEEALRQQALRSSEIAQLNKLGELMQSCLSVRELSEVLCNFSAGYLEAPAGGLYLTDPDSGEINLEHSWGDLPEREAHFPAVHCWGLRRGHLHPADDLQRSLRCQHVSEDTDYVCLPLTGNGESLGLLHLRQPRSMHEPAYLDGVANRAALALISLKTRDALFDKATHDPLTGLYNRRYLDELFEETERRAKRHQRSIGVMMIDIDHFKAINDQHGHDAGDMVLRAFAELLRRFQRQEDIAGRYGGEEFVLLLHGANLAATRQRAEQLRQSVEQFSIRYRDQSLKITISLGIAAFPAHGERVHGVLNMADQALYMAKHGGRNRVAAADELGTSTQSG